MKEVPRKQNRIVTEAVIRDAITRAHYERSQTFHRVIGKLGRGLSGLLAL